jgi:hypothetical protein
MIATTLSMFPPETLSMIEAAAENCAKNMKVNPNGQIDEATLMSGVNSMLTQMMGSGSNPFGSLLNTSKPRQQPKTSNRKKKSSK